MGRFSETVSDAAWRWRCKLGNATQERTLADYKSEASASSTEEDPKHAQSTPKSKTEASQAVGQSAAVKTFYESPESDQYNKIWVDYPPRQPSKKVALAQGRVAFRLYKVKDLSKPCINGKYALKHHMVEIQNSALITALKPILAKEDVHLDPSEQASFSAPFRPLYFCYDEIVAKCNTLGSEDPLQPFMLLFIKVMDEIFADLRHKKKSLQANGLVSYANAWSYFKRDAPIITQGPNCQFLCKVIGTELRTIGHAEMLVIKAKALKFTGESFVWVGSELVLEPFKGNKLITELDHYPLEFHADPEGTRQQMEARGRLVLDYQGLTYCNYEGLAIFIEGKKVERHNVEGRILIDVVGYNKHHLTKGKREDEQPETQANTVEGTGRRVRRHRMKGSCAIVQRFSEDSTVDNQGTGDDPDGEAATKKTSEHEIIRLGAEDIERNKATMLAQPDDLMYMSPLLQGFALKNKEWLSFFVEDIKPMVWNDTAYEHLVYSEEQKDLVLSFVESHKREGHREMDDVIVGKGQGLIMLLSGPPGTGKTLMAEAVADRTHRPLFYLQAEDLGISAASLGANLKKVFTMATEWNAVILLDEADVFLSERHPQDIARNELVSIFLRELEYFRGIIFLTTNLYQTIDTAFRSRVSLHLLFSPLTADARWHIWRKFLDRIPPAAAKKPAGEYQGGKMALDDDDIKELSLWNLNGREVKNAVKMAKTWCDYKGFDMTLSRVENSIKVTSPHASRITKGVEMDLYD